MSEASPPTGAELSSMLLGLGILASSLGDGDLAFAVRGSGLTVADLKRELADLDGRLRRPPDVAWEQFRE